MKMAFLLLRVVFLLIFIAIILASNSFLKGHSPVGKYVFYSEDKVQVITNPKTPVPSKAIKKGIVFKDELTIGVAEGDENYVFGNSVIFTTDDGGNFYVNDWDRKKIQKYDSKGKYLLTIGRQGQGPGEFQNLWGPKVR